MTTKKMGTETTTGHVGLFSRLLGRQRNSLLASAQSLNKKPALGKKVLVVDDDQIILKTTTLTLEAEGYDVITARDGSAAIEAARQQQPHLILLDISYPADVGAIAWDGFLIAKWLNLRDETKHIPIVFITGNDKLKDDQRAIQSGAMGILQKPLEKDIVLSMIERLTAQMNLFPPGVARRSLRMSPETETVRQRWGK